MNIIIGPFKEASVPFLCGMVLCGVMIFANCKSNSDLLVIPLEDQHTSENEAEIIANNNDLYDVSVHHNGPKNLQGVTFVDADHGYAYSNHFQKAVIYETRDKGVTWKELTHVEGIITGSAFLGEGKIVIVGQSSLNGSENRGYIINGSLLPLRLEHVLNSTDVNFQSVRFNSAGTGVAVGFIDTSSGRQSAVFLSKDSGYTWSDISDPLLSTKDVSKPKTDQGLTDAFVSPDNEIDVVSLRGEVFHTENLGKSWTVFSKLQNEPAQTGIRHLVKQNNQTYWIFGGAVSDEGIWSLIARFEPTKGWQKIRVRNYSFSDMLFLTPEHILASGSFWQRESGMNVAKAIILFSSDGGKTWSIIYTGTKATRFSTITNLSNGRFFISSDTEEKIVLNKKSL